MTRIFITGASGFVGGAAAARFVQDGHVVRCMSRSPRSDEAIAKLGAAPVRCDLESVAAADLADAELVIHCAAFVEQWGAANEWKRFNVDGTARMLAAAQAAGVRRFIHIGTEAALFRGQHLRGVDETYALAPRSPYPYSATKAQAELLVRAANGPEFHTVVLRPRFIWGPGDTTLLPLLLEMARAGKFMWVNHGAVRTSTTHIDNLVHAIDLARTKGFGGEAYFILDDGVRTMREIISGMAQARGVSLPDRSIPGWAADLAGAGCELLWRVLPLRGAPPLTRFSAMILTREAVLKDDKARFEMGYKPVITVDAGLLELRAG